MKKAIAVISLFALFAALLTVGAFAAGEATIVVSSATASDGQAVVTVSLENNPGIASFLVGFDYDTSKLELTSIETGGLVGNWRTAKKAVWVGDESTYSGVILTLTFKVLDGVEYETVPVTVTYDEGDICNWDVEDVDFAIKAGSVRVPCSHSTTEIKNAKDATCTEAGYTGDTVCTVCGETVTAGKTIAALGHDWNDGEVTAEATCTGDGVKTYTCDRCNETKTETIAALGHSYDEGKVTTEPTCTAKGVKTYTCSVCGDSYTEELAALGHDYVETVTREATADEEGERTYACSRCGDSYTEVIPKVAQIEVSSVTGAAGNEVVVTVSLKNNPGIAGLTLDLDYDTTKLTSNLIENCGLDGAWTIAKRVVWTGQESTYDGVILKIHFTLADDLETGEEIPVTVTYEKGDICDYEMNDVTFEVAGGCVTVENHTPGDVNNDDKINSKDLVLVMRYIAGERDFKTFIEKAANVNGDTKINSKDLVLLMRYISGEKVTLY